MAESKEFEYKGISITTELPGPEAKRIIDLDERYLVRSTKSLPIVAKRGRDVFIEDVDGNVFLDFSSGISVTNVGHVHPKVKRAVMEQLDKLWHFAGTDFYYEAQVNAAKAITEVTPGSFNKKVFFTNSGAESNEAAIKLAKGFNGRQQFVSFIGAFHGRTQGALSLTASKAVHKKGFFPTMPGVEHVPYPNPYRNPFGIDGYEEPDELTNRVLDYIEKFVFSTYLPPEDVSAFVVEPIQGEGGYIVPPMNFHKKLFKLASEHDILVIMDEVQTGFGRTGKFFASEHFGVEPEMISLAKSIASGIPMGAVVVHERLNFKYSGMHSNTYGGNLLASVASMETIKVMKEERLVENSAEVGSYFKKRLEELKEKYSSIGDVRGIGLMLAIDFVKDRRTKEPDPSIRDRVFLNCYHNGLISLPTGSSALRFIPPLTVKKDQVDMAIDAIDRAIKKSL